MPQVGTRKRPAPGASPMQSPQNQNFSAVNHNGTTTTTMTDPYVQWPPQNPATYPDPSDAFGSNLYTSAGGLPTPPQSNQLTRRSMGQQIMSRPGYNDATAEGWPVVEGNAVQASADGWINGDDDLNRRAETAKRETQAKRKQIPPFVQKLSR